MRPERKGFSLKWGLLGIIIGCWFVPILLMLGSLAYYTAHGARKQLNDSVRALTISAAAIDSKAVSSVVEASRYATYDGTVRAAYQDYMISANREALYKRLNDFLAKSYRYDDNFYSAMIFLVREPSNIYYTFNTALEATYTDIIEYQRDAHAGVIKLADTLDTRIGFYNYGKNLYMVRNIVDDNFKTYAVIVMQLNKNTVFGSLSNIMWKTEATVFLNGVPVSVGAIPGGGGPIEWPRDLDLTSGELSVFETGEAMRIYGRESVGSVEMFYAVDVDIQGFLKGYLDPERVFYLLVLLPAPLLALAVWFLYRNIFTPVRELSEAARIIWEGNLGYQVSGKPGNREFSYLTGAFNGMSTRLKQQFERIYSEELALRDARIMALQSQINPHFLNNTLEIINWEVRLENNAKVSKMIEALAIMLDAAMDRKSSPLVKLSQEIMYVDSYLYIISERFGKRLKVIKEIDVALLRYEVPRLIMQPIIENAIEHGVSRRQNGTIMLRARRDGETMLLEVQNDVPMSETDVTNVKKLLAPDFDMRGESSMHLGIHNVNMRLKMIYGEMAGLSITSNNGCTLSSVRVPLETVEPERQ